ncbi:MAG TPA: lipid II flippase MurJ, partial [Pirellulales bacterium]
MATDIDRRESGRKFFAPADSASKYGDSPLPFGGMSESKHHPLLGGAAVTSLGTLLSRILGLVRDSTTAALFGLATGGVLDALTIAFRIPNLFRALFGEGALTASYMPVF